MIVSPIPHSSTSPRVTIAFFFRAVLQDIAREAGIDLIVTGHKHEQKAHVGTEQETLIYWLGIRKWDSMEKKWKIYEIFIWWLVGLVATHCRTSGGLSQVKVGCNQMGNQVMKPSKPARQ